MPPSGNQVWITVYFMQNKNKVGLFLTFRKGSLGDIVYEKLRAEKESIDSELAIRVEWSSTDGKHVISISRHYDDVKSREHREQIKVS